MSTTAHVLTNPLGVDAQVHREIDGIRLTSASAHQVVQMRTNDYTFSQLAPYSGWTTFYADGKRVWRDYCEVARPALAVRAALLYINRIVLPDGDTRLDQYLRTRPEISPDMPTTTSGFFLTLDIPIPQYGCTARVMQTILQADEGTSDRAAVMLDIDVFAGIALAGGAMQEQLDELFHRLRATKNLVFEASITEATRRLFA